MPLELVTLRCLKDNYAYLLHGEEGTVLIDALSRCQSCANWPPATGACPRSC